MKLLKDTTIEEIDRAINEEQAYVELHRRNGGTGRHHNFAIRELKLARKELERQQRRTTPHNKTRLGDLWPVEI